MDTIIILGSMVMVCVYMMTLYFYNKSKQIEKNRSDIMIKAVTAFHQHKLNIAYNYFQKAYKLSLKSSDLENTAESLYYMALILKSNGKPDSAMEFLNESLHYYEKIGNEEGIEKIYSHITEIKN
ncbi:MAG: hypothetical protein CIT03_05885 [Methanobacterium sp.]|nr:MAG: hypothetical protein CIT03_05885 [Methanobacterium sp.]